MSVRREIQEKEGIFFITITCYNWLPLFERVNGYEVVYYWFDYLKKQGHFINGYVIMPNHLHALISFTHTEKSINKIIGNGKRFMAYDLVKRLHQLGEGGNLMKLQAGVNPSDSNKGKLHEVFEPSFDWKACVSDRMVEQKLNYIHNNPCQGKWNLADDPIGYVHSSATFYESGNQGIYEVKHYMEMDDFDLTNYGR